MATRTAFSRPACPSRKATSVDVIFWLMPVNPPDLAVARGRGEPVVQGVVVHASQHLLREQLERDGHGAVVVEFRRAPRLGYTLALCEEDPRHQHRAEQGILPSKCRRPGFAGRLAMYTRTEPRALAGVGVG